MSSPVGTPVDTPVISLISTSVNTPADALANTLVSSLASTRVITPVATPVRTSANTPASAHACAPVGSPGNTSLGAPVSTQRPPRPSSKPPHHSQKGFMSVSYIVLHMLHIHIVCLSFWDGDPEAGSCCISPAPIFFDTGNLIRRQTLKFRVTLYFFARLTQTFFFG